MCTQSVGVLSLVVHALSLLMHLLSVLMYMLSVLIHILNLLVYITRTHILNLCVGGEQEPELPDLGAFDVHHDGAGSQYVCCKNSRGTAEFWKDVGVLLTAMRHEKHTFGGSWDGHGSVTNDYLRRMVAALDLDIDTVEKFAELCANAQSRIAKPKDPENAHGDFAANRHIFLYYSDAAIKAASFGAEELVGVTGYRCQAGVAAASNEATGFRLKHRHR